MQSLKLKNETKKNICNKGLISRIQKQLLKSTGKITRKTRKSQPETKKPNQNKGYEQGIKLLCQI